MIELGALYLSGGEGGGRRCWGLVYEPLGVVH